MTASALEPFGRLKRKDSSLAAVWWVLAVGFVAMYAPTYWEAATELWTLDEHGHGPIVALVVLWLFWRLRQAIASAPVKPLPWSGALVFGLGLVCYMIGRLFAIASLQFASQLFVVAGALLWLRGGPALRAAWFAVFYFLFVVPLPSSFIAAATGPLKQWTSAVVVDLLSAFGYPIAHAGVILSVGPYRLLVADACSGLNSITSLAAVGVLYLYLVQRKSVIHNALLAASILPIALAANTVRVVLLVLITYHMGDEAGQSFLHGASGLALFLAAMALLFGLDACLLWATRGRSGARA